jgi:fibronectin type 3 domain-containing protein
VPGSTLQRLLGILGPSIFAAVLASCCACASGSGSNHLTPAQHSVTLSWKASTTSGVGYNVYRGTQHSGSYPLKLNSSPQSATTFTDSTVQSGATYFYVVTAEDANHVQSDYSNEVIAKIP